MPDRQKWRQAVQAESRVRMDTLFAPIYDQNWGATVDASHGRCVAQFIALCPPGAAVLDAACGTGKYWPLLLAAGLNVSGIDHSAAMLRQAQSKHPTVPVRRLGLQELADTAVYHGLLCVDALESVFPEDWPLVLANFRRALRPGGALYCTVELTDPGELERAYRAGQELGLPVLPGEVAHQGGYHFYPELDQVRDWVSQAGFGLLDEAVGDEYHHLLLTALDHA